MVIELNSQGQCKDLLVWYFHPVFPTLE